MAERDESLQETQPWMAAFERDDGRPIVAVGNSNGDVPMLRFARGKGRPALRLLVAHDDPEHEFDYAKGAETALAQAKTDEWAI